MVQLKPDERWGKFKLRGLFSKTYVAQPIDETTWAVVECQVVSMTSRVTRRLTARSKDKDTGTVQQAFIEDDTFRKHYEPVDDVAKSMFAGLTSACKQGTMHG